MPKCDLCGQEVGLFRKRHKDCEQRHQDGIRQVTALARKAALSPDELAQFEPEASGIAANSFLDPAHLRALYISGWEDAVATALEDGLLSESEQDALISYRDHFSFSQADLDANSAFTNLVKASTLQNVLQGDIPHSVKIEGEVPFNFQKEEALVWFYNNVEYLEERSRTYYTGGYAGASMRVAKGVYYRFGGFRGNPVVTAQMTEIARGYLGITQKHSYFAGGNKAFRIPYNKIVSFRPFSDGFGVQREAASARPQIFVTGDGWFIYNLVANLAKMAGA